MNVPVGSSHILGTKLFFWHKHVALCPLKHIALSTTIGLNQLSDIFFCMCLNKVLHLGPPHTWAQSCFLHALPISYDGIFLFLPAEASHTVYAPLSLEKDEKGRHS